MKNWNFTIYATGLDPNADDFEDRFFEAGCDDALVGFVKGVITLDFDREAKTMFSALVTALRDVQSTGAEVLRIGPDSLVNESEIAERSNRTRAAISLYVKGQRGHGHFPLPAAKIASKSPLWNWTDVAKWFYQYEGQSEMRGNIVRARIIDEANAAVSTATGIHPPNRILRAL